MLLKLEVGASDGKGRLTSSHSCKALGFFNEPFFAPSLGFRVEAFEEFLAVVGIELGFVVEEILLRGCPVHEEEDDPLGLGGEVEPATGHAGSKGLRGE